MQRPIQSLMQAVTLILFMTGTALLFAAPPSRDDDPTVTSADPASAVQGERKLIMIYGEYFAPGASVRFLVKDTKDSSQIDVIAAEYIDETTLEADIHVLDTATVSDYDIEVRVGSRKGKGTTFRVESKTVSPSECHYDFAAEICDYVGVDPEHPSNSPDCISDSYKLMGLRSDSVGLYPAFGGMGFRLDTNGSQKLEGRNDDRKITVDFAVHDSRCDETDDDPAKAAGFCMDSKGSDIRIEHMIQDPYGLCILEDGESVAQVVVVNFEADDGGTLIDPNRNGQGPEPLILDYGCGVYDMSDLSKQATVTRHSEWDWSIVGTWACLHTQLGELWDDESGDPIWIYMPFHIHMTRVDAP